MGEVMKGEKKREVLEYISNHLIFTKEHYKNIGDTNSFKKDIEENLERIRQNIFKPLLKDTSIIIRGFITYWSNYYNEMLLTMSIMKEEERDLIYLKEWDKFYSNLKMKLGGSFLFRIPEKPIYIFERRNSVKQCINNKNRLIDFEKGWKCVVQIPEKNSLGDWEETLNKYVSTISNGKDDQNLRMKIQALVLNDKQKTFADSLINELKEKLRINEREFYQIIYNLGIKINKYKEDVHEGIIKSLLLYFASMPAWNYLYYIPAQVTEERPSGGLVLYVREKIPDEDIIFLRVVINRIFGQSVDLEFEKLQEKYAFFSAVGNIMSRNMSHHIGSHVISRSTFVAFSERLKEIKI